jgi:hypothetical protein
MFGKEAESAEQEDINKTTKLKHKVGGKKGGGKKKKGSKNKHHGKKKHAAKK